MLAVNRIHQVDVRAGLAKLPDESVDCVMTSPPYWAKRDYQLQPSIWGGDPKCKHDWVPATRRTKNPHHTTRMSKFKRSNKGSIQFVEQKGARTGEFCVKCNAWKGCLGLEPTVALYIAHLVEVFAGIKRILKPTGTVWVNLGDTYAGSWGNYRTHRQAASGGNAHSKSKQLSRLGSMDEAIRPPSSIRQSVRKKSLCLIPMRFVLAMADQGWLVRNVIVWHKPNRMPESIKDRFSTSWEYLIMLVKSPRYYFNLDAVRIPHKTASKAATISTNAKDRPNPYIRTGRLPPRGGEPNAYHPIGKNPGDCWSITTKPCPGAHFAVFPDTLCERPILAGCPTHVCIRCGTPRREFAKRTLNPQAFNIRGRDVKNKRFGHIDRVASQEEVNGYSGPCESSGKPLVLSGGCRCSAGFEPGLVLDPFAGSGTTALVASRLGRRYLGFELNDDYIKLARKRILQDKKHSRARD